MNHTRICSAEGCTREVKKRAYCPLHAARIRRHGDPKVSLFNKQHDGYCTVDGCNEFYFAKNYCRDHYSSLVRKRKGSITYEKRGIKKKFVEQFLSSHFTEDCVNWPFKKDPRGYGFLSVDKKKWFAHRYVLYLVTGGNPLEMDCCHSCGNPSCVNPRHLRWDTHKENMRDAVKHGRSTRGRKNAQAKLTREQVRSIREDERSQVKIAKDYGISRSYVSTLKARKTWAWLK